MAENIGCCTYFANKPFIHGIGELSIGKYCSVGRNVTFILWGHRLDWFSSYPFGHTEESLKYNFKPLHDHNVYGNIKIGNDVYIGANSIIMYGSNIGDGAVISAGSVVRGKVKPYTVVAGNPTQFVYTRFDNQTVSLLLKMKWWDWDTNIIKDNVSILQSNDINKLKELYEKYK